MCELKAVVDLSVNQKSWSRPPIQMKFEVVMFAASGTKVKYLKYFSTSVTHHSSY